MDGALLRAALEASCLRGALPPVDLRAVCLVRAIVDDELKMTGWGCEMELWVCVMQEGKFGEGEGGGDALIPVALSRQGGRLIWENKSNSASGGPCASLSCKLVGEHNQKTTQGYPKKNKK